MKSALIFLITALVSSTAFSSTFTVKASETLYYYAGSASQAAEAKLWKSALDICQKGDSNSGVLPIRISEVIHLKESSYLVSASAQFQCMDAEGREF